MGARIISIFTTRMMMNDRFLLLSFSIFLLFSCNNHKENMCLSLIKVGRFACHRSTLYSPVWKIKTYIFLPAEKKITHYYALPLSFHRSRISVAGRPLVALGRSKVIPRECAHTREWKREERKNTHTQNAWGSSCTLDHLCCPSGAQIKISTSYGCYGEKKEAIAGIPFTSRKHPATNSRDHHNTDSIFSFFFLSKEEKEKRFSTGRMMEYGERDSRGRKKKRDEQDGSGSRADGYCLRTMVILP